MWSLFLNIKRPLNLKGMPSLARPFPLEKQSTGLFFNSPFAKRFATVCGALTHTLPGRRLRTPLKGVPPFRIPLLFKDRFLIS